MDEGSVIGGRRLSSAAQYEPSADVPPPPPVRGIAGNAATRVEDISATIAGLTERVHRIGDRAFGSVPQAAGTEANKELSASGEVGRLKDSFRKIEAQLKELTGAIDRIIEL